MQLLVTVEERQPRVVGDKVKFHFLKSAQQHHVLDQDEREPKGGAASPSAQGEAAKKPRKMVNLNLISFTKSIGYESALRIEQGGEQGAELRL